MRSAGPAWRELGPEGNHQQHRQPLDPIDDAIEQLEARGIEPVSILGRHEHRLLGREALELGEQRLERLRLLLFRCKLGRRVAVACRDRQMLRDQWDRRFRVRHGQAKQCLQLGQLHLGRIVVLEAGGPTQLVQHREQRAVGVVGRAVIAQRQAFLAAEPLAQGDRDARLADARLARQQHYLALPSLARRQRSRSKASS